MSNRNDTDVYAEDHRYVGRWHQPSGSMRPIKLLPTGWNYVSANTFAFLFYQHKRAEFIGNQHGKFSVTTDIDRNTIVSSKLFRKYFNDENCPYSGAIFVSPFNPADIDFMIVLKPIHELWFLKTQLFFETMDATEKRNQLNEAAESALSVARAESIVRASTPSIEKIKKGLDAEHRVTYTQIKSEILDLMAEGKIHPLSNLEVERITLMRMIEIKGMLDVLATDTLGTTEDENGIRSVYTADAVKMMNLMRQIGNEAQRMTETSSTTKKNGKSAFQALEEMVKSGQIKMEISAPTEKPKPIDADYKVLLDDKEG